MARKKTTRKRTKSSSRRSNQSKREPFISLTHLQKILMVGILVIFVTAVLVLSLIAPNQGQLTSWLSSITWQMFGWGSILVPIFLGALGLYLVLWGMDQRPNLPTYRLIGVVLLFVVFVAFASMIVFMGEAAYANYWEVAQAETGGGYAGGLVATLLTSLLGNLGTIFTLAATGLIGAVLVSGISRADVMDMIEQWRTARAEALAADDAQPQSRTPRLNRRGRSQQQSPQAVQLPLRAAEPVRANDADAATSPTTRSKPAQRRSSQAQPRPTKSSPAPSTATASDGGARGTEVWTLPTVEQILEAGMDQDLNNAAIREQVEVIEHTLESFGAPATVVEINQGPTITQFGVEPNYIEMRNGRRTKVKVGKIASLADDLALALAARSLRIQAPVPGKGYVGIEVPNPSKALVSLRDVMESSDFRRIKSPLAIGLGQNVAGQAISTDLTAMPHLLIAGTTGSGKSVCVNGIIACLLLQNSPNDLKLVMIDPKRVELTGYNGIPHLAAPVVVDMDRVISTLQWALREMDTRYQMFAQVGARNIIDYNKKIQRHSDLDKMPYIVIIIDELADLMMLAPEDTERAITRLAQMARATGIHVIIATQRPSVDVVTGLIKANFPARIAFAVASGTDSRVILDTTGAERLLGQGDMLFQSPDAAAALRLQGCFVSDGELNRLITYWRLARRTNIINAQEHATTRSAGGSPPASAPETAVSNNATARPTPTRESQPATPAPQPAARQTAPEPAPSKPAEPKPAASKSTTSKPEIPQQQPLWEALQEAEQEQEPLEQVDELMPEAIALVRKLNKASTSLLQRRFRIGYTRAARMIDAMEEAGIIGPPTGTSKAREVIDPDEAHAAESEESPNEATETSD